MVHAAVVLIPLGSVLSVTGVVLYRRFPAVLPIAVLTNWVAAVAAFLSVQSGEALGEEIGTPQPHGEWGEILGPLFIAFTIVTTLTWWFRRRSWRLPSILGTLVTVLTAPVTVVLTVLVGHGGALATWGGVLAEAAAGPTISEEQTANRYSLDEVSAHNTVDDCWIAVDGAVYDVSGYAASHPGGASEIEQICGTDATEAFQSEHSGETSPNNTLAGFQIGLLN